MSLIVDRKPIDDVLDYLRNGFWQIPKFQREFIWTADQVKNLANSILKNYPIGLITTWDQPQSHPHTESERLKLKGEAYFGNFSNNPAVMKLVLDGKQRLTTIAMVFGGFKSGSGNCSFHGEWFLDLDAYQKNDETRIVQFRKQAQISKQNLGTISSCILQKMIPFKDFHTLSAFIAEVHNPAIYPTGQYPSDAERNATIQALTAIQKSYTAFSIPFAEIPNTITLGDVCEIFDVLNTTGTKVSTFDLLHNQLYQASKGKFNLRDTFEEALDYPSIGQLCDERRQDFFCQIITGCYLAVGGVGSNNLPITSIKGPDLINTPLPFYTTICSSMNILDGFADDLFRSVLGVDVSLSELPYPASSVIYLALRWKMYTRATVYGKDELNALFKAFFWRNVLTSRYDQGFLTQFSIDLKRIEQILDSNHSCWGTPSWISKCNYDLDALFGASYPLASASWIKDTLLDEDTRGALRQLYIIFVKSTTKHDIVNNLPLDWGTTIKQHKVQMHHIFPQATCNNIKGSHPAIQQYGINHIANLCPLQALTNNVWKANSPATAILNFQINYANNAAAFSEAFIDTTSFHFLSTDDVEHFWPRRADSMANLIYACQLVQ